VDASCAKDGKMAENKTAKIKMVDLICFMASIFLILDYAAKIQKIPFK
jgi:hypothetical protein